MAMWPLSAYYYASVITRYRLMLEVCFRRLDVLLEELKASQQEPSSESTNSA
jgi:hypothetical protein